MTQPRSWYTRKGDRRIDPEHVNIKGKLIPTGFYGGFGTETECPDCQTVLHDEWYSEPGKIHPQSESLVSASVKCEYCGSEFELLHRTEEDISSGIAVARKELRPIQMATALFAKAVVNGVQDLDRSIQAYVFDAILRRCDKQLDETSDQEVHTYLGRLVQGLKMLSGHQ